MNLQIQHIAKEFHNGTKALADVDFSVSQGEFVSVIGPSGAGKTTLFRILNGMMECTGGQVLLDDKRFDSLKGRKNVNCKNPSQLFIRTFVWWRILPV